MSKTDKQHAVAQLNWDRYVRARDAGHTDYIAIAKRCNDFYMGNQWSEEDIAALKEQNRPYLTVNRILPTINTILGEQVNKRAQINFVPKHDSSPELAQVLNKVAIQIMDNNNFDYVETQVFEDGIIEERGYFDCRMSFDDNIHGEVRITSVDPRTVVLDPDAREYDPDTWSEVVVSKWMTIDEIELTYGKDKVKELKGLAINSSGLGMDSIQYEGEETFGDLEPEHAANCPEELYDINGRKISKIRVIDRQYRKMSKIRLFVDMSNGDTRPVPESWDEERVQMMRESLGLQITNKFVRRIRWTVTADTVVLHDDWSPYERFTIVPYFPYFRRGKPFGVVRNLLSPQEQYNKIKSQELHIVNTTANSGYMVQQGSLTNMTADQLAQNGAKTGTVIEYAPNAQPPAKIQPNQIPTGLDNIGKKSAQDIKDISGISDAMLGTEAREVSGRAIEAKLSRGMVQIQVPFDNLNRTRTLLARHMLELIQQYYTDHRVLRITDRLDMAKTEMVEVNAPDPTGGVLNDLTLGEYDVTVTDVPSRATYNDAQFVEALSMREAGIMVPDHVVIQYSHLENKHELVEQMKQMTGFAPPSPEEQEMMQMQAEMDMQMAQLKMQEMQAKIEEIAARAKLASAKADDTKFDEDNFQLEVMKLQADLAKAQATLDNKTEIARLQAEMGQLRERQGQTGRFNQIRSAQAPGGRNN